MLIYDATMTELPPLPEPDDSYFDTYDGATVRELYEAMRSYAAAAVAAERERCARICNDALSAIWPFHEPPVIRTAETVCRNLADRIRAA